MSSFEEINADTSQRISDFSKTLASIAVKSGVKTKVNLIYLIGFNLNTFPTFELSWAKELYTL